MFKMVTICVNGMVVESELQLLRILLILTSFRLFLSVDSILYHNTNNHLQKFDKNVPKNGTDVGKKLTEHLFLCRWPSCDSTPRSKWSMVTHLQVFFKINYLIFLVF